LVAPVGGSGFLSETIGLRRGTGVGAGLTTSGIETGGSLGFLGSGIGLGLTTSGIETGGLTGFAGTGMGLGLTTSGIETGGSLGFLGSGIGLGLTTSGIETGGSLGFLGSGIGLGLTTSGIETGGLLALSLGGFGLLGLDPSEIGGRCLLGVTAEVFGLGCVGAGFFGVFESAEISVVIKKMIATDWAKIINSSFALLTMFIAFIP